MVDTLERLPCGCGSLWLQISSASSFVLGGIYFFIICLRQSRSCSLYFLANSSSIRFWAG